VTAAAHARHLWGERGVTLTELMVSVVTSGIVLLAAWPWCWAVVERQTQETDRAEASTSLGFAQRLLDGEVRSAVALSATAETPCTSSAFSLDLMTSDGRGQATIDYGYDRARGVVWRGSRSSYVADGVTAFSVEYLDGAGLVVGLTQDDRIPTSDAGCVRRLRFSMSIAVGSASLSDTWEVALRSW
jgi:Tfp pilus assembly protein FimT